MPASRSVRRRSASLTGRMADHRLRRRPHAISRPPHNSLTRALPRQASAAESVGHGRRRKGKGDAYEEIAARDGGRARGSARQRRVTAVAATAVAQRGPGTLGRTCRPTVVRQLQRVNFIGNCMFSHRNTDDPIVFPNTPGASHDHSFVGNQTTNAFSTVDSLLGGRTTCRRSGETAAYWMPTLYVDGNAVRPPERRSTTGARRSTGAGHAAGFPDDRRRCDGADTAA